MAEQASSKTAQENEPRSGGNDNKTLKSETEQGEENTHPPLDSSGVSDDSKMSKKEGDGKKDSTQLDTTMETTLSSDEEKDESLNESSQEGNDRQEDPQLTGTDVSVVIGDTQPKPHLLAATGREVRREANSLSPVRDIIAAAKPKEAPQENGSTRVRNGARRPVKRVRTTAM